MGRRGPKPKPNALKILRGNPGKRPLPKEAKTAEVKTAAAPSHMGKHAKSKWRKLVSQLTTVEGLLTVTDLHTLELYCDAYQEYREAGEQIAELGPERMLTSRRSKAREQLVSLGKAFGLSPSWRVGMPTAESETESMSDWQEFLAEERSA